MRFEDVINGRSYHFERVLGLSYRDKGVARVTEIVRKSNGPWLICEVLVTSVNNVKVRENRTLELRAKWLTKLVKQSKPKAG